MRAPRRRFLLCAALVASSVGNCSQPEPIRLGGNVATVPPNCEPTTFRGDTTFDVALHGVRVRGRLTIDGRAPQSPDQALGLAFENRRTHTRGAFALSTDGAFSLLVPPGRYDVTFGVDTCAALHLPCGSTRVASDLDLTAPDTVRNFDVRTARITGRVRVDGDDAPVEDSRVRIIPLGSPALGERSVPIRGDHTYEVRLAVGTYRFGWSPADVRCGDTSDPRLPCSAGTLERTITVDADASVDLDIPSAVLQARFTANGSSTPPLDPDARLVFANDDGLFNLHVTSALTASRRVFASSYEVSLSTATLCAATTDTAWPCSATLVSPSFALLHDTDTTIDIRTVRVSGEVMLDGTMFPQLTGVSRGSVIFRRAAPARNLVVNETTARIPGMGGPARFDARLAPGRYDVIYRPDDRCDPLGPIPCVEALLARDASFESDATTTYDLQPVPLSITFTQGGAPLPERFARGSTRVVPIGGSSAGGMAIPATGPSRVVMQLSPGRYSVFFVGPSSSCEDIACGMTPIRTDVRIDAATDWTFDVPRAVVHGRFTFNGVPMTRPAGSFPLLRAFGVDNGQDELIPSTGDSYRTTALGAGRYYMVFESNSCGPSTPPDTLCVPQIVGCP